MSSIISLEEMQTIVQDEYIKLISDKVTSPLISFWQASERITEEEMEQQYKIFNIFCYITHFSKKCQKTKFNVKIGRDFDLEILGSRLDYEVEKALRSWGRDAAVVLDSYFTTHYEKCYIGKLRFDLLTKDKENFVIPNFRLETNIYLYPSIAEANASHRKNDDYEDPSRISFKTFVEERLEDKLFSESYRANQELAKKD